MMMALKVEPESWIGKPAKRNLASLALLPMATVSFSRCCHYGETVVKVEADDCLCSVHFGAAEIGDS